MSVIKALAFDVGGTVFDWKTAVTSAVNRLAQQRSFDVDAEAFANDWRSKKFELLGQVRAGDLPWMNADAILLQGLESLSDEYGFAFTDQERIELVRAWHRMTVWDDFPDAIVQLRKKYCVAVLTILSFAIAVDCSRLNGVYWDGVISCEFLGHYKPEAAAYQEGCRLLGLAPERVMMVASHPLDLVAASKAGLKTAFVKPKLNEPDLPGFSGTIDINQFDVIAADFAELATKLDSAN